MTTLNTEIYPKLIRDFFRFDHSASDGTAHRPITLPFAYAPAELLAEAEQLPYDDRTVNRCYVWGPVGKPDPGCDLLTSTDTHYTAQIDLTSYPKIKQFIDSLTEIGPVTYLTFKRMAPKGYIMPHIDSECNPYKIYVPLSWPEGSQFKMLGQGNVDFSDLKPNLINTSGHMHAVVNDSSESRIIFSFYVDWSCPGWQKYLEHRPVGVL